MSTNICQFSLVNKFSKFAHATKRVTNSRINVHVQESCAFYSSSTAPANSSTAGIAAAHQVYGHAETKSSKRIVKPPIFDLIKGVSAFAVQRFQHRFKDVTDQTDEQDVSGKIVVITGAGSGIGKVLAKSMARRKATVVMACRDMAKAEKTCKEIEESVPGCKLHLYKLDLSDLESVQSCTDQINRHFSEIKILINNAACMSANLHGIERMKKNGFEKQLVTNHLGPFLFTLLLLNKVTEGTPSRIITLSSSILSAARLDPNQLDLNYTKQKEGKLKGIQNFLMPYYNSKLANALTTKELASRLKFTHPGVTCYSASTGIVNTNLFNSLPLPFRALSKLFINISGNSPEQGAETPLYCALSNKCVHESGHMYDFAKMSLPASQHITNELAYKVWKESEKLVGLKYTDIVYSNEKHF